jgi:hypothetical protein
MLQIASVVAWTVVGLTAIGWLAIVGIEYLSGNCHGVQECYGRASLLNNIFWLFFAVGVLVDGTQQLMRRLRRHDQ